MRMAVQVIGWLIVSEGILFLISPEFLGPVIRFFNTSVWMFTLSVLRIVVAAIFLIGSIQCRLKGVIVGFGLFMLITGFAGLIIKRRMCKLILQWWQEIDLTQVRLLASLVMLIGALVVYSA